jgi:hypothetical protein
MWHALRAELAYFRPWLFGGLGLAVGVALLVSGIFYAVGKDGPEAHVASGIRAMFLMMAPAILGFVILALRTEEGRTRLLMAGPVTPRELAGVSVLIPIILFATGVLCATAMLSIDFFVTGAVSVESAHLVGYVGGLILMMQMIGFLGQEAVMAHRQDRSRAAGAGWAILVVAVLALAALTAAGVILQGPLTWPSLHVGNLVAAVVSMAAGVVLYAKRTDFTR